MAKFIFKLEPVLKARLAAEQEGQRAVATLERKRLQIEGRLRRQQSMIVEGRNAQRRGLIGAVDTVALRGHAASTMRLMRDAQGLAVELAKVYESTERARADLAQAAAARRAIELLRERRFSEWKRTQEKREAAALDDLASSKAARRRDSEEVLQ